MELYVVRMNLLMAVVNLGKSILAAESSQVIEPVSVTKLSEQKAGLECMKVALEMYIRNNEDAALVTLTDMVNDACKQSRIVHNVLTIERHGFYMSEW